MSVLIQNFTRLLNHDHSKRKYLRGKSRPDELPSLIISKPKILTKYISSVTFLKDLDSNTKGVKLTQTMLHYRPSSFTNLHFWKNWLMQKLYEGCRYSLPNFRGILWFTSISSLTYSYLSHSRTFDFYSKLSMQDDSE